MIETHLFEQVADAVRSMDPAAGAELKLRVHRRGLKAWFATAKPTREHYEAQLMPRRYVDGRDGAVIEVGFHSEHKDAAVNEAVINQLKAAEKTWRNALGNEAEVGVFFGADNWRRVSEVWLEADLDDPDLAFEIAARLVDYLAALQPVLSADGSDT